MPAALGETEALLADAGYFGEANVEACVKAGVEPAIAMGRQPPHSAVKAWICWKLGAGMTLPAA